MDRNRLTTEQMELLNACKNGEADIVRHLLSKGISPNYQKSLPLRHAIAQKRTEIVNMLIDAGANLLVRSPSPIIIAAMSGNVEIFDILIDKGADPFFKNGTPLRQAIMYGNTGIAKRILQLDSCPGNVQPNTLVIVARSGNVELLEFLLRSDPRHIENPPRFSSAKTNPETTMVSEKTWLLAKSSLFSEGAARKRKPNP